MIPVELQSRLEKEMLRCIEIANRLYGKTFPMPTIAFDVQGVKGGFARQRDWSVHLNRVLMLENVEYYVNEVCAHEFAHLVDAVQNPHTRMGRKRSVHGPTWKRIMRLFGVAPKRCHRMDTASVRTKRQRRFTYKCSICSNITMVGPKHHRGLMVGRYTALTSGICKHTITKANFVIVPSNFIGRSTKEIPVEQLIRDFPKHVPPVRAPQPGTKMMRACQLMSQHPTFSRSAMIEMFKEQLAMSNAGAQTYYYNTKKLLETLP